MEAYVALDGVVWIVAHVDACGTVNAVRFVARDAHKKVNGLLLLVVYDHAPHHRHRIVARHAIRHGHEGEQEHNHRTLESKERVAIEWIGDAKNDVSIASHLVYHARFHQDKCRKLTLSYFCDGAKGTSF